eukprot:1159499-Pelagomonas_calceolata.AAC.1
MFPKVCQLLSRTVVCHKLHRYKRGELEGKNVSCLMPQPFASRHNSYLQAYVDTVCAACCCSCLPAACTPPLSIQEDSCVGSL